MNIDNLAHLHFPGAITEFENTENESFKESEPEIDTTASAVNDLKSTLNPKKTKNASKWTLAWKLGQFIIINLRSVASMPQNFPARRGFSLQSGLICKPSIYNNLISGNVCRNECNQHWYIFRPICEETCRKRFSYSNSEK